MEPGQQPRYSVAEAALIVGVPAPTLRTWFRGRRTGQPAILRPDGDGRESSLLSFFNVVEARFLGAYRRRGVSMQKIRSALDYVRESLPSFERPLLRPDFETDGKALFIQLQEAGENSRLLEASAGGQFVWPEAVQAHFKSLDFDDRGDPTRLWLDDRRDIMLDPRFGWGLPVISGSGIRTDVLYERLEAGEELDVIAEDFSLPQATVKTAIAWEQAARRAA